jgi:predicted Asp-tRNA(Asn)/Glu-tRNA(Gln) amidotransferase subunit C
LSEERLKEIERSAEEIVESFLEASETLPTRKETYYSHEVYNIMRPDGEPSSTGERSEFRKAFLKIMPHSDENGNLKVEVAKWAR